MDLLTKQSSDLSGHEYRCRSIKSLSSQKLQKLGPKDGLDDETLLAGYKCSLHSKPQSKSHSDE